ncbi:MAG: cyclic nucleotide-binding domain-containing protein [Terrimicrobiaceae bacterium]|nr:cyclic nucleotide-binding domain-containing protein [Terrimicrobiaceae bacterium]
MEESSPTQPIKLQPDDPRLAKFRLFAGLGPEELATLLQLSDSLSFPAGNRIFRAGEEGHSLYVLLEGSVRITVESQGREIELSVLSAGDFFGEISLVDDGPRSAHVTALEDCTLLRITRMTIGVLAGLQPAAAIQILGAIGRALVKRLRASNEKYVDILLRTEAAE